jgi:hypothetical protein
MTHGWSVHDCDDDFTMLQFVIYVDLFVQIAREVSLRTTHFINIIIYSFLPWTLMQPSHFMYH